MKRRPVVALAGGVGAARFLDGLARVVPPARLFIIGNTGDDAEIHGLHISPDLDTVTYTLAGLADPQRGWGIRGDRFGCLEALGRLGGETWFQLGDRDLGTHLYRTDRLRQGATLTEITAEITARLGVRSKLVPMSDARVRTRICTAAGELEFQTYFVKRRARDKVASVRFEGAAEAKPAGGVLEAIAEAEAILFCPSNPFISIHPILAVPGIREALERRRDRVAAVSPIVGGRALKGPAAAMMKSMNMRPSAAEVARLYTRLVGLFVMDEADRKQIAAVENLGMRAVVTGTVMHGRRERKALARVVVREMGISL
ncbi:MAG TPA: 2-phospho-L-lactate transferase [Bryobacteraceae bacterium]|nr:2-phospho-L-lactate transferase [Bryobacteraceae bacterium]